MVRVKSISVDGSEFRNITDHSGITTFLADLVGKFVPDIEPVTVLFIDLGTTNFDFAFLDHSMAESVDVTPSLRFGGEVSRLSS